MSSKVLVTNIKKLSYASEAASSSGITSLICMPNTNPIIDNVSIVELLKEKPEKRVTLKFTQQQA